MAGLESRSDEHDMLRRHCRGELSAFADLFARCAPAVIGYVAMLTQDREAAEEVAQDVFCGMLRQPEPFLRARNFRAYLLQAARRRAMAIRRQAAKELPLILRPAPEDADDSAARAIQTALLELPEEQRETVVLHVYQELTFEEIGEVLRIPVATAKSRYRLAVEKLKEKLRRLGFA